MVMHIPVPKSVWVLGHEIKIEYLPQDDPKLEGNWGQLNTEELTIYLSQAIDGTLLQETLFHEVLHAVDCLSTSSTLSERNIFRLSSTLFATLRDNRYIAQFIMHRGEEDAR